MAPVDAIIAMIVGVVGAAALIVVFHALFSFIF